MSKTVGRIIVIAHPENLGVVKTFSFARNFVSRGMQLRIIYILLCVIFLAITPMQIIVKVCFYNCLKIKP